MLSVGESPFNEWLDLETSYFTNTEVAFQIVLIQAEFSQKAAIL